MKPKPTVGRIVLYVMSAQDALEINRRRTNSETIGSRMKEGSWPPGAQAHIGTKVEEGDILPAQVVRVLATDGPENPVNLKVNLDGTDQFWATDRFENSEKLPGTWHWMEYQIQKATEESKTETEPEDETGSEPEGETGTETESSDPVDETQTGEESGD